MFCRNNVVKTLVFEIQRLLETLKFNSVAAIWVFIFGVCFCHHYQSRKKLGGVFELLNNYTI